MASRLSYAAPILGFFLAATLYWQAAETIPYNPDESHWLATTAYLRAALDGDLSSSTWKLGYWTLAQPPLARYTLGAGLLAAGLTPGATSQPWQFGRSDLENPSSGRTAGTSPPQSAILVGRHTSALLGAVGVAGFAAGVVVLAGPWAGLLAAILLAFNPLLLTIVPRAMAEGTMLAAIGWSFWSLAVPLPRGRWLALFCLATGLFAGLGMATKLKAALSLVAIVIGGFSRSVDRRRWALASTGVAFVVFYLVNPALWYAPIDGPVGMYVLRVLEMGEQTAQVPPAGPGLLERLWTVAVWLWESGGTLGQWWHLPFDVLLAIVGARQLVVGRHWPVAAWALVYLLGTTLTISLVRDRYLIGPVIVVEVLAAIGLQLLVNMVRDDLIAKRLKVKLKRQLG